MSGGDGSRADLGGGSVSLARENDVMISGLRKTRAEMGLILGETRDGRISGL